MKNKIGIVLIITAVLLSVVFNACDGLIAPMESRNNPNDSENPIKMPTGFTASVRNSQPDRVIEMQWSLPDTSSAEGYLIIRGTGSAPENIWDGVISNVLGPDNTYIEDYENAEGEYPVGYKVYYSLFAYGPKWSDMAEEDKIDIQSGDSSYIYNAENYNFVGPVSDSVVITGTLDLNVTKDGYADNGVTWYMNIDNLPIQGNTSIAEKIAFIKFNIDGLADVQDTQIENIYLKLTAAGAQSGSEDFKIDLMTTEWENATDWGNVINDTMGAAYDSFYTKNVAGPSADGNITRVEISDYVFAWYDGIKDNYGLRLRYAPSGAMENYTFWSSESLNPPVIEVEYYNN